MVEEEIGREDNHEGKRLFISKSDQRDVCRQGGEDVDG